jgi:hypothetical protein
MCLSFLFLSLELAFIFVLIDACYRFPLPFPSALSGAAKDARIRSVCCVALASCMRHPYVIKLSCADFVLDLAGIS